MEYYPLTWFKIKTNTKIGTEKKSYYYPANGILEISEYKRWHVQNKIERNVK